jgi:hypothetical protein
MIGGGMYGKDVYNPDSPDYQDSSRPDNYRVGASKGLNVNNDNDTTNAIYGNNSSISSYTDNSIRNYEGDHRTFNYEGSGNGTGLDTPASMATMAGFYSPSDSPSAIAARLDQRVTSANDYAKDNMNTSNFAQNAIDTAAENRMTDPYTMNEIVKGMGSASKADAYLMGANIYGDLGSYKPNWQQPNTPKPLESPYFGKNNKK